mmetsp:Transcript_312/g.768  ORF Transcript_312/g.768 Transcript_312/m.768 type:complete len:245 (+) Transcript_312:1874-2608(+)
MPLLRPISLHNVPSVLVVSWSSCQTPSGTGPSGASPGSKKSSSLYQSGSHGYVVLKAAMRSSPWHTYAWSSVDVHVHASDPESSSWVTMMVWEFICCVPVKSVLENGGTTSVACFPSAEIVAGTCCFSGESSNVSYTAHFQYSSYLQPVDPGEQSEPSTLLMTNPVIISSSTCTSSQSNPQPIPSALVVKNDISHSPNPGGSPAAATPNRLASTKESAQLEMFLKLPREKWPCTIPSTQEFLTR